MTICKFDIDVSSRKKRLVSSEVRIEMALEILLSERIIGY